MEVLLCGLRSDIVINFYELNFVYGIVVISKVLPSRKHTLLLEWALMIILRYEFVLSWKLNVLLHMERLFGVSELLSKCVRLERRLLHHLMNLKSFITTS